LQLDYEFRDISMLQDNPDTPSEAEAILGNFFVPLTQEIWAIRTEQQRQAEHIAALENRLQVLTQIIVLFPEQLRRLGSGVEFQLSRQKEVSECTERDLKIGLEKIKVKVVLSKIESENQQLQVLYQQTELLGNSQKRHQ
jgi:hypothetical protein